jgi:Raf kinase inhibitor-like YbhB/YbcL family protein
MMVRFGSLLTAGAFVIATVCAAPAAPAPKVFELTSSSFRDGGHLAIKNAGNNKQNPNCVGENVSPPLAWTNPPDGTKSFALLMFDPEGRGGAGVSHMVIYGIPASVTGFAEGELSQPSDKYVGGKSTMGLATYFGPCTPPNTDWHHYTLVLIATDLDPKALEPGLTREDFLAKLNGHAKGSAGLIGKFRHPEK